ncbi:hypothetical protein CcaverHIS002_0703490 [Cutaneotrichosporon cavernicola]|uniref:Uncharacterized protein n=1 Tax=Cutaneotrichosporon cavernicola TaxID=279322 RepID=A0AA48LA88_9TREE|nr:uncharacterized protein CcaverHIS019_0703560 [Cutaneotrichosporon cavernicola]BEI87003.1 hypothetical protein CcaverHIS002_0703490 [Cutaneotrichosporon cavernicola]BEI94775.1 hypothetical protein CcaverHIS019_0703560 [Cutaneotrichosporon cavernicola]BEJ02550.1 hypothetical protein CcaverHIS631_0703450 [Cutaneotrichosporon cavernicola]BEJ10307.1 hypothetical protein CcaverHIS641_0703420 [Cutaneotrichosporon cavernicola]
MSSIVDRLNALKAQEDILPLDDFAQQLKDLHLEERAQINASWTAIAHEKARHVAERSDAQKRLADAKRRQVEAAHHIAAAQRQLDQARREVADVEAEIASTDSRISTLAKDIEKEYIALAAHVDSPAYQYFASFMVAHPGLLSPRSTPSSKTVSLPASPEAKAIDKIDVVVEVVEVDVEVEA